MIELLFTLIVAVVLYYVLLAAGIGRKASHWADLRVFLHRAGLVFKERFQMDCDSCVVARRSCFSVGSSGRLVSLFVWQGETDGDDILARPVVYKAMPLEGRPGFYYLYRNKVRVCSCPVSGVCFVSRTKGDYRLLEVSLTLHGRAGSLPMKFCCAVPLADTRAELLDFVRF